jgi:hypothetical protein
MKKILFLLACLLPLAAWAQTYPTPTFTNVTLTPAATAPAANGQIVANSTQNALETQHASMLGYVQTAIFIGTATVTTSGTTAVSLIPTGIGSVTLPANYLVAGKTIVVRFSGTFTTASTPGTIAFSYALGASTIASPAAVTPTASLTTFFEGEVYITCRTTGSSGSVAYFTKVTNNNGSTLSVLSEASGTATVNTTVSNTIAITSTNSVAGGTVLGVNEFISKVLE